MLFHLNPYTAQVALYELDPSFVFKTQMLIEVIPNSLSQMQVVDSLLVIHNLDDKSSQAYDLRLPDYHIGILDENLEVNKRPAQKGFYISDMIY